MLIFDGGVALSQIVIPLLVFCLVKGYPRIFAYRRLHHVRKDVHFVEQPGLLRFERSCIVQLVCGAIHIGDDLIAAGNELIQSRGEMKLHLLLRDMRRRALGASIILPVAPEDDPAVSGLIGVPDL